MRGQSTHAHWKSEVGGAVLVGGRQLEGSRHIIWGCFKFTLPAHALFTPLLQAEMALRQQYD